MDSSTMARSLVTGWLSVDPHKSWTMVQLNLRLNPLADLLDRTRTLTPKEA